MIFNANKLSQKVDTYWPFVQAYLHWNWSSLEIVLCNITVNGQFMSGEVMASLWQVYFSSQTIASISGEFCGIFISLLFVVSLYGKFNKIKTTIWCGYFD